MLHVLSLFLVLILSATMNSSCSNAPCKIEERGALKKEKVGEQLPMTAKKDLTKHIRIYKQDGSLQCGMGQKIDLAVMAKDLEGIQIFSSENSYMCCYIWQF